MLKKAFHILEMAKLGLFVIIVSSIIFVNLDCKIVWLNFNCKLIPGLSD